MRYQPLRLVAAVLTMALAQPVFSAPVEVSACYKKAGLDYGIDPDLLLAIGIQESHLNNSAINKKSFDYCQMQVNSVHDKELKDFGINLKELTSKPCTCIYSGTWVLAKFFQRYGRSWDTVGMYNAGNKNTDKAKANRASYSLKIRKIYTVIKMEKKQGNRQSVAMLKEENASG